MALALVRSCLMSRVTIGQLRVLQSKPPCLGQGAEFPKTIGSNKIRASHSHSFYSLNPPVIEEFKLGSHVINLEVGSDELNRTSIWCHMNGTTAQSSIMVSHYNHKDNKVLKVHYVESPYGLRLEPLKTGKKCEHYNPKRFIWDPCDPTDEYLFYINSSEMTDEGSSEYDGSSSDQENDYDETTDNDYDETTDPDIICSQLLYRSIRPLIPENFHANVKVFARLFTLNSKHDAGLLATIASSAALMISNITPSGPLGVIRMGRINEKIIINPTEDELRRSDIKLLYVCTRGKTIMVDLEAREISVDDLVIYLKLAHLEAVKCIESQVKLRERFAKDKKNELRNLQDTI
uniref:Polyribonucleotide nucleotidyltransferase 2, mitochondrial n=1 Tax=Noccaea caerulescens TaxID=107243 RepID=A0A1J3FYT4_NOCCA